MRTYLVITSGRVVKEIDAEGFEIMDNGTLLFFRKESIHHGDRFVVEDILVKAFAPEYWIEVWAKDEQE